MANKILRFANAKSHYFNFFFYKINKGELPFMYSCVFWCEFLDLVGFFGCYCVYCYCVITLYLIRSKGRGG